MCLVALSAAAQEKIDPQSMYVLRAYADGTLDASVREAVFREPASRGGSPMVRVLVEKTGGAGSVFEEAGYAVTDISRDFSLVEMPVDDVEAFSMRPEVVSMSFGRVASTTMDVARKAGAVDLVHSGFGLGANLPRRVRTRARGWSRQSMIPVSIPAMSIGMTARRHGTV